MMADAMPRRRFSFALFATKPVRVGPAEQPRSPARARSANIAVPPLSSLFDETLKVPGHIMPTANPAPAMPTNDNTGFGVMIIKR